MSGELSPIDKAKFVAAKRATQFVQSGMRVGLGDRIDRGLVG
jgi:ribose 5-phosphate isomerase A